MDCSKTSGLWRRSRGNVDKLLTLLASLPSFLVSILIEIDRERERSGLTTEELFERAGIRLDQNEQTAADLLETLRAKSPQA
jgi:hypothetical protein